MNSKYIFKYAGVDKDGLIPDVTLCYEVEEDYGVTMQELARMFRGFAFALTYPQELVDKYIKEYEDD